MKKILALTSLLALGSFASAQDAAKKEGTADKKKCATACSASACSPENCDGTLIKFAVTGLENDQAAISAKVMLDAQSAINYAKGCEKSGTFTIKYNPEKTKVCDIEKVLTESGLKITGQKASYKIAGLACQSCSNHLTTALAKINGVKIVDKVCHRSGHAEVTFDPVKTDAAKIKAAIAATKYKVVEASKKAAPATAPQS